MSTRQTQLPPRCPIQKQTADPIYVPISPTPHVNVFIDHSSSKCSSYEEEPLWLNDLLCERDSKFKGQPLRRSASDSITLLEGLADSFRSLSTAEDEENSVGNGTGGEWDPSCIYGPNSPRRKSNLNLSTYSVVSALSDFVHLHQDAAEHADVHSVAGTCLDSKGDVGDSASEVNSDLNAVKRHTGQRSRVRKLQYIAELERKVNVLQTVESDLAIRVASMLQQRVALSMENGKLKQQVARARREKLTSEGRHQALKKELEKLKSLLAKSADDADSSNSRNCFGSSVVSPCSELQNSWWVWRGN